MPDEASMSASATEGVEGFISRPVPLKPAVARPVANLGNTCYMNAVLQALAHAPELCQAMDAEPHHVNCPIYMENSLKRRSSPSSSPDPVGDVQPKPPATRKSRRSSGKKSPTQGQNDDCKFCALCEVEHHVTRVHAPTNNRDKPVAPSAFVSGFIQDVAPWFKLGDQEDSHEFLRLLIDAMQRSCKQARKSQENPQDTPPEQPPDEDEELTTDVEYPFQLFRGTVESNVTCESCKSSSSTLDPIEDIGLDISTTPTSTLADVASAFQRFARAEALDSGYKCEKCGKVGRATKQSRLASIPPILTLHLKRFRYGETQKVPSGTNGQSTRRSGRTSETTGSAKIEGHSKFKEIFDLKPYLTEKLQAEHSKMFCRLFAVIVHAGKNSHSGHYIAYVRNVAKNEWWKMDDARVTLASFQEVMNAEAYMLFYRVVEHPLALKFRDQSKKIHDEHENDMKQQKDQIATKATSVVQATVIDTEDVNSSISKGASSQEAIPVPPIDAAANSHNPSGKRKRKAPDYVRGDDWLRAVTNILPEHVIGKFADVEQLVSEFVHLKSEFFKIITEQASKGNAKVGHGPSTIVCGRFQYC